MFRVSWRWALAGLALLGCTLLPFGRAQGPVKLPPPRPVGAKGEKTRLFYGNRACGDCHRRPEPRADALVRCVEQTEYEKNDRHADAYNALLNPRARRMGERLGYEPSKDARCLSCHAAVIEDEALRERSKREGQYTEKEGVNCALCHGEYREWVIEHGHPLNQDRWRALTPQAKWTRYGLRNLADPATRADLCASCHVGNRAEGKFVTHEMYAAGHPPLPSFELATFSRAMPPHWLARHYKGAEKEQTHLLLVGAAVTLRTSMRLLADQANEALKARSADQRALDLANFDCYACHHELRSPSRRATGGRPGRVPMRAWPTDLARLAVEDQADLDRLTQGLRLAFERRPYGDVKAVADGAAQLADWADGVAKGLAKKPTVAVAEKLLLRLPGLYRAEGHDYDSARQVAWAFRVLAGDARPALKGLGEMERVVRLGLPTGRPADLEGEMSANLRVRYAYDPEQFRRALADLERRVRAK